MKPDAMRPLTVSLTSEQADALSRAVARGDYASDSEVVRDALDLWEQRERLRETEIDRLKQAYCDGLASGTPVDGRAAMAEIRGRLFIEDEAAT